MDLQSLMKQDIPMDHEQESHDPHASMKAKLLDDLIEKIQMMDDPSEKEESPGEEASESPQDELQEKLAGGDEGEDDPHGLAALRGR